MLYTFANKFAILVNLSFVPKCSSRTQERSKWGQSLYQVPFDLPRFVSRKNNSKLRVFTNFWYSKSFLFIFSCFNRIDSKLPDNSELFFYLKTFGELLSVFEILYCDTLKQKCPFWTFNWYKIAATIVLTSTI